MSLTRYVSEFVTQVPSGEAPDSVRHLARRSILDGLGLAVAGAVSEGGRIIADHVAETGGRDEATVLGSGQRSSARLCAFANGFGIHADDYDDTQLAASPDRVYGLLTHPTAPVLPAVLALAERDRRSGEDLLGAYLIGVEVATKVAEAINPRHYGDGFHSTATMGAIGAGAAVARLQGLTAEQTSRCLGIAASQAAGLRENFGTMTKPFHAGRAAESGIVAADLAKRGFTAASTILEADRGFFRAAGGGWDPEAIDGALGNPWTFDQPGISIKPHPSGSLTHPGMGAFLDLVESNDLIPDEVAHIRVGVNRYTMNALLHHRPENELQAKFSLEFCIAILLLRRRAGLTEFTDEVVTDDDVQETLRNVNVEVDAEAEAAGYHAMTTIITVTLRDGRKLETRAAYGKGSPQNPMSDDELVAKFLDCLAWGGVPEPKGKEAAERVYNLEAEADPTRIISLLQRPR